jgi:hypothetical protein
MYRWIPVSAACLALLLSCSEGDDNRYQNADSDPDVVATDSTEQDAGTDTAVTPPVGTNTCTEDADCGGRICVEGLCLVRPPYSYKLTNNYTDEQVADPIELGCVGGEIQAGEAGPSTATIYGVVDRFGSGRKTIGIEVAVFRGEDWPPEECTSLPLDEQRACFRESVPPEMSWLTLSTDPELSVTEVPTDCDHHRDCPSGYECTEIDLEKHCLPQFGLYELADIPTNTWLVIRGRNDPNQPILDKKWKDTYLYGVYVPSQRVDADGRYRVNALMVSDGQWTTIPNTLSVPGGIKAGNGALGGRIRDCGNAERQGYTIGGATVDLEVSGSAIGFFNDDEDATVPVLDRVATDIFGRFTIVDIPPGANRISAAIDVDGEITSLGGESFYIIPDSLSVVSFPGKDPILNK